MLKGNLRHFYDFKESEYKRKGIKSVKQISLKGNRRMGITVGKETTRILSGKVKW